MPTTEIISVGAECGPHTPRLEIFAQRCDSVLMFDRDLFQEVFRHLWDGEHNLISKLRICQLESSLCQEL